MASSSPSVPTVPTAAPAAKNNRRHRKPKQPLEPSPSHDSPDSVASLSSGPRSSHRHPPREKKDKKTTREKKTEEKTTEEKTTEEKTTEEEEKEEELCYICTEPIVTYAVSPCDHRTCHLCAVRLRSLYKTRHCAYCKAEQKTVIFTKDPQKPFDSYTRHDTPFYHRKLGGRFEEEQTYQDTLLILQFNCPESTCQVACENGWGELKKHVKKAHDLNLCDLCTRHKKIFAHEHTLYTYTQLQKHCKQGDKGVAKDDDTGFKGHPECQFCRINFYGNDELYEHCRDKHEECHLCVRRGIRHEYFVNYEKMETHFKNEHFLCLYRECLEKKFVVFEGDIDLKAHEVEEHGASVAHLPRAKQAEARRVEVEFDYNSTSRHHHHQENRPRERVQRHQPTRQEERLPLSSSDFPSINNRGQSSSSSSLGENTQPNQSKRHLYHRSHGLSPLGRENNWPSLGESSQVVYLPVAAVDPPAPTYAVSRQAAFLDKVGTMMKSVEKVVQLRQMAASYRDSMISARSFVDGVCDLCNNPEHSAAIFQSDDFIEEEEKRSEAVRVWRQLQKSTSKTSEEAVGHTTSPRVKVIKSVNTRTGGNRPTSRINVWDRVAHAAEDAESSSSLTPLVSLPNGRSKTAWSTQQQTFSTYTGTAERESTLSAPQQHFPSLPAAPPRYGAGLRQATRQSSAWTSGINDTHASEFSVPENVETPTDKKRKGKKKQVLFRVGL